MADANMLAADCVVISCCCECMILQILIFILLKLPNKLVRKTKEYARKFRSARDKRSGIETGGYDEDSLRSLGKSFRIDSIEDFCMVESIRLGDCCMDEIERVLGEFSSNGEFAFGSFWGGEVCTSRRSFRSFVEEDNVVDYDGVRCRLMDLFGDVNFADH